MLIYSSSGTDDILPTNYRDWEGSLPIGVPADVSLLQGRVRCHVHIFTMSRKFLILQTIFSSPVLPRFYPYPQLSLPYPSNSTTTYFFIFSPIGLALRKSATVMDPTTGKAMSCPCFTYFPVSALPTKRSDRFAKLFEYVPHPSPCPNPC